MILKDLLRENIKNLQPYSCARDEFKGEASVFLDANENPFNAPFNRYPDPHQMDVKKSISKIKKITTDRIFLGNGSDEAIDLLYRAFCEPNHDNVVAIEPTYGMYKVCADINSVDYRKVILNDNFDIEAYKIIDATNKNTKIIWLCSPNNPTGNSLNKEEILKLLHWFRGIVVIDEAYIDFSSTNSYTEFLKQYPNLVVLQTFSKAWGNAAIRLGMAFASPEIIQVLNRVKYPYNVNLLTQRHALYMLKEASKVTEWVSKLLTEREILTNELLKVHCVKHVYPSDANFILVKVSAATSIYNDLTRRGIVVRNRTNISLCQDCLRITVGTNAENKKLLTELKKY